MDVLNIKTVFLIKIAGCSVPVTETVLVSWLVMAILIAGSLILTRQMKLIPRGPQAILEAAIEFLNKFAKEQFGSVSKQLGPYIGTLFLFLLLLNIIPVLSPLDIRIFGREFEPPFSIRTPTRDLNLTAGLAIVSIFLLLVSGFAARGVKGWFKHLLYPLPIMLPFNLIEYGTRLVSLSLRLFGNMLGGFVVMRLVEGVFPIALPMIFSLYFDFFDGLIQAAIFVFLSSLYISEAVKVHAD